LVDIKLLGLLGQVLVLGGGIVLPRVEIRHGGRLGGRLKRLKIDRVRR
jgi:hypothetical protein